MNFIDYNTKKQVRWDYNSISGPPCSRVNDVYDDIEEPLLIDEKTNLTNIHNITNIQLTIKLLIILVIQKHQIQCLLTPLVYL